MLPNAHATFLKEPQVWGGLGSCVPATPSPVETEASLLYVCPVRRGAREQDTAWGRKGSHSQPAAFTDQGQQQCHRKMNTTSPGASLKSVHVATNFSHCACVCTCVCVYIHVLMYLFMSEFILELEDCPELEESRAGHSILQCVGQI